MSRCDRIFKRNAMKMECEGYRRSRKGKDSARKRAARLGIKRSLVGRLVSLFTPETGKPVANR